MCFGSSTKHTRGLIDQLYICQDKKAQLFFLVDWNVFKKKIVLNSLIKKIQTFLPIFRQISVKQNKKKSKIEFTRYLITPFTFRNQYPATLNIDLLGTIAATVTAISRITVGSSHLAKHPISMPCEHLIKTNVLQIYIGGGGSAAFKKSLVARPVNATRRTANQCRWSLTPHGFNQTWMLMITPGEDNEIMADIVSGKETKRWCPVRLKNKLSTDSTGEEIKKCWSTQH